MKKVLVIGIVVLSLVGIAVIVYAAGTQTSSKSNASACTSSPEMVLGGTKKYDTMTIYNLKLINTCNSNEKFTLKISGFPNEPEKHKDWTWKFENGEWNEPFTTTPLPETTDITLTIQQPVNGNGLPKDIEKGIYQYFEVETKATNANVEKDILDLIYSIN